ncbi:MAG: hypothetical protein KUF72_12450, partial [Candidatus Thiodiazotropha sp. (ex Ctena orbiculata)]|nr:hypothetical protein [Candidatus Thiodiazotropha taylori]
KCGGEARVIASIEDQQIIDKILAHLMKKGALPPPPELLPATRASPDSGWFTSRWVFTLLSTAQQQKERLPGGLLPEPGRKARTAVEEGGFSQKSRGLNR